MWGRVWGTEKGEGEVWPLPLQKQPPLGRKGGLVC